MYVEQNEAGAGDIRVGFSHGGGTVEISVGDDKDYHVVHLGRNAALRIADAVQKCAVIIGPIRVRVNGKEVG